MPQSQGSGFLILPASTLPHTLVLTPVTVDKNSSIRHIFQSTAKMVLNQKNRNDSICSAVPAKKGEANLEFIAD